MSLNEQESGAQYSLVLPPEYKLLVVSGEHVARTEQEYGRKKKRLVDLGEKFFKRRGWVNILRTEDSRGVIDPNTEQINRVAEESKSFRFAYWHVQRGIPEGMAWQSIPIYDKIPVMTFLLLGQRTGSSDLDSYMQAFLYSQFAALDELKRKGYPVQLASEKASSTRREYMSIMNQRDPESWRRMATLVDQTNQEWADEHIDLLQKAQQRVRLFTVAGSGHEQFVKYLPAEVPIECQSVPLIPNTRPLPGLVLLNDLQTRSFTDLEIRDRLRSVD